MGEKPKQMSVSTLKSGIVVFMMHVVSKRRRRLVEIENPGPWRVRGAHASRVLVEPVLSAAEGASRRNRLFSNFVASRRYQLTEKSAIAKTGSPACEARNGTRTCAGGFPSG